MCKIAFDNRINNGYYYDNYIHNRREAEKVPVLEAYYITAKLGIIYTSTAKYSNFLLSSKC